MCDGVCIYLLKVAKYLNMLPAVRWDEQEAVAWAVKMGVLLELSMAVL